MVETVSEWDIESDIHSFSHPSIRQKIHREILNSERLFSSLVWLWLVMSRETDGGSTGYKMLYA